MKTTIDRRAELWPAVMEASSPQRLRAAVARAHRRGELATVGPVRQVRPGVWAVPVGTLRPLSRPPRWRKPVLVTAGVVVVLGSAAALGWWLVAATVAALPVILGGAAVLALLLLLASSKTGCAGIHCPGCGHH